MIMRKFTSYTIAAAMGLMLSVNASAQDTRTNKEGSNYKLTVDKDVEATDVKNQYRSSTCWSFSTLSFFESELKRMGKGDHNLSEMFVVRHVYEDKAEKYVRLHGALNFAPGGAFHDVAYVLKNYGLVPQEVYAGANATKDGLLPMHNELDNVLKAFINSVIVNHNGVLSHAWFNAYKGILDAYLGELPVEFEYQGKKYTPRTYADMLGLKADDYVELSSFTHHPFYTEFAIEVPDNWLWGNVYNLPIDEMMAALDHALDNGYTAAWGADVSEKGFSFSNSLAIIPKTDWSDMSKEDKEKAFTDPVEQMNVTQDIRQEGFDNYETQDDHGMQITGYVHDQNGTKYYIVKNSWGTSNYAKGYMYASEAYVRAKTIDIMVHKSSVPKATAKKLGLN